MVTISIEEKITAAKAEVENARTVYGRIALEHLEGTASAPAVASASKELEAAKRRVSDLTAAGAAAEARAIRQAAHDAEVAAATAAAAKVVALGVLRDAAKAWDATLEKLKDATAVYDSAAQSLSRHQQTAAELHQLEAARTYVPAIIEHRLQGYLFGAPKSLILGSELLKLETHIPKAAL